MCKVLLPSKWIKIALFSVINTEFISHIESLVTLMLPLFFSQYLEGFFFFLLFLTFTWWQY